MNGFVWLFCIFFVLFCFQESLTLFSNRFDHCIDHCSAVMLKLFKAALLWSSHPEPAPSALASGSAFKSPFDCWLCDAR